MPLHPARQAAAGTLAVTSPADRSARAVALIERIEAQFHAPHRDALAGLLALAQALPPGPGAAAIAAELRALADGLEQHMFKEEARLFPMMAQGGNTLLGHLMADLHREHEAHGAAMQALQARLDALAAAPGTARPLQPLAQGVRALAAALAEHIRTEDDELFPLFQPAAAAG